MIVLRPDVASLLSQLEVTCFFSSQICAVLAAISEVRLCVQLCECVTGATCVLEQNNAAF